MSDQFNHFHYLNKKLLDEQVDEDVVFNWEILLNLRKLQFKNFQFIVSQGKKILYSEISNNIKSGEIGIYLLSENFDKIYWIKLHDKNTQSNDMICLNDNNIFIHEDIGLQKSNQHMHVISHGNNEYYYFNKQLHHQLFLNKFSFELAKELKFFSINLNNQQKQKNIFNYTLESNSKLQHNTLSCIQEGQLLDDSIECIHGIQSISNINYESLIKGKISVQVNSIIGPYSKNCETHQNLKHIALNKDVIINSKPNLMIDNPHVVASHGSSTGSFSKDDLFYLEQRGLNKEQSFKVLSESRITDFISKTSLHNEISSYIGTYYD